MPVANASWDLQAASRGRFVLGLGSADPCPNENRFSVPWSPPARGARVRRGAAGDSAMLADRRNARLTAASTQVHADDADFTPESHGQPMVPVTIPPSGRRWLRVAGELCDGVALHGWSAPGAISTRSC